MESVPLEMDDIFGAEEDVDQVPQMLPDLPEAEEQDHDGQGEQNEDETENKKVLDKLKGMKGASKNTVKRPMPKLDSSRLTGERGIPILPRIFKDVKLKGKGHEVEDLRVVMRYLEHWGHRLFPMMPFDEVLARVERLGAKREVQTCVKKIRLDIPVLGSDTVSRGEEGEEEEEGGDTNQDQRTQQDPSAEDLFDALIQEEQELETEMSQSGTGTGTGTAGGGHMGRQNSNARDTTSPSMRRLGDSGDGSTSQPSDRGQGSALPLQSHNASVSSDAATSDTGLSTEVLERIAMKRRLAMEKRAKKLGIPVTTTSQPGNVTPTNEEAQDGGTLPGNQPDLPTNQPDLPNKQPDLPSNQPDLPSNQPDLPGKQPDLPSKQPDLPSKQPVLPSNQSDTAADESVTGQPTQEEPSSQSGMVDASVTANSTQTQPSKQRDVVAEEESVNGDPSQEMESLRGDPTQEMESLRGDPSQEMESLRGDPTQEMESLRGDPTQEMESLRGDPSQEMAEESLT